MQTNHFYSHRITDSRDGHFQDFWNVYDESFPLEEKRVLQDFGDELKDPRCHCLVYPGSKGADAILCYWDFSTCRYIEYFSIAKHLRGSGVGTEILKSFIAEKKDLPLVLEIEPLSNERNIKRWHFYQRLGFVMNNFEHRYPAYFYDGIGSLSERVIVLSHGRELSSQECQQFISDTEKIEESYSCSLCKS